MSEHIRSDVVVIGGGPGGQKAAIEAAQAGQKVILVDRSQEVGGECAHRGTIPSKTLRETAVTLSALRRRSQGVLQLELAPDIKVASLMKRLRSVLGCHQDSTRSQLERSGVELLCGKASLSARNEVTVEQPGAGRVVIEASWIVLATGSRPRRPEWLSIDHEHVLDSDSILSMIYLPRSLVVLGGGVIACEFASIMAALGVEVTMIDGHAQPLGFLDSELTARFLSAFEQAGGTFLGNRMPESVQFDGISVVETRFANGECIRSEKALCALGRQASVDELELAGIGVETTERGYVAVDQHFRTAVDNIIAIGDIIGPPALAATAMDQGRRAMRYALGLPVAGSADHVPVGIYTIPELACVGLTDSTARQQESDVLVGRAPFHELARGQITGNTDGLLKLVFDASGERLLGAQIVGEGATEIIHVAQMALYGGMGLDAFLENTFNFPTLGEAYRVAAIDAAGQLAARESQAPELESSAGGADDQPENESSVSAA